MKQIKRIPSLDIYKKKVYKAILFSQTNSQKEIIILKEQIVGQVKTKNQKEVMQQQKNLIEIQCDKKRTALLSTIHLSLRVDLIATHKQKEKSIPKFFHQ